MTQTLWFAGLPTQPDVRALMEQIGVPVEGVPILYETVAAIIKAKPGSGRYHSVVSAWRRQLKREHDVYLRAKHGAFTRRTPVERIDLGAEKVRAGARAFNVAIKVVSTTDRTTLAPVDIARADHLLSIGGTVRAHAVLAARQSKPLPPGNVGRKT